MGFSDILVLCFVFGFFYLIFKFVGSWLTNIANENALMNESVIKKAKPIIKKHKKQLSIQRKKSVYTDAYGKEVTSAWKEKEVLYFVQEHILPSLSERERNCITESTMEILATEIDKNSKSVKDKPLAYKSSMSGFDFEVFCADKLESEGWKVSKTANGADQGIDLIIKKGKREIGVQCKKYSRPIGNKSVQEVKTGLLHYGLKEGVVLGNNKFTKSAIQLAASNDIKLIHYLETESM